MPPFLGLLLALLCSIKTTPSKKPPFNWFKLFGYIFIFCLGGLVYHFFIK